MNNNDGWIRAGAGPQYPTWDENANTVIMGKFVERRNNVGPNNSSMYILEVEGGEKQAVWGSTVIDGRFEEIPLNALVRIEYLGKTKGKGARGAYKNYNIDYKPADENGNTPATPANTENKTSDDLPF